MLQKIAGNARMLRLYGALVGTSAVFTTSVPSTTGRWALFIVTPNTTWAASVTMTITLQDSADDSTFADVSPTVSTQITTAQAATTTGTRTILVDLHRLRGYARLSLQQGSVGNCNTSVCVLVTDYVQEGSANAPGLIAVTGDSTQTPDSGHALAP